MITEIGQWLIENHGNTAGLLDLRPDIMSEIDEDVGAFVDKLIPSILGDAAEGFFITYTVKDETITFNWRLKLLGIERTNKFKYSPCVETKEGFIDKIRAYLFNMCVALQEV